MRVRVAGAIATACLTALAACSGGSSGSSVSAASGQSTQAAECSPFGNPPATIVPDHVNESMPSCFGGRLLSTWQDDDGTTRYACHYEPLGPPSEVPLPLLVFIHGSGFPVDQVIATNLLELQNVASLSADASRVGFILLGPSGRSTTHFYPAPDDRALGWDNWYRQLDAGGAFVGDTFYPENVDAATIDHFIAEEIQTGRVDPNRIYLTGWSNGSAMAYLYALSRPTIAAIAVYSAPDPFHAFNDPCPQLPVFANPNNDGEIKVFSKGLQTYHIHNDCDITGICPNGERMASILRAQGIGVEDVLINSLTLPATGGCLDVCGTNPDGDADPSTNPLGITLGTANHGRWPQIWTSAMLEFLRQHPLDAPRP